MKKLTLIAALLGSVYFANAQVGINTITPATSAELDIVSNSKGILIPRVALTDINVYAPVIGSEEQSLLVFNINEIKDANNVVELASGFYYWENGKWNLVVNQTHLDEVIKNIGGDITNVLNDVNNLKAVINYILPSNPGNDDPNAPTHTTIVYEGGKFFEVTYNITEKKYETTEIDIENIIAGFETDTFIKEVPGGYIYFNEKTIVDYVANNPTLPVGGMDMTTPGAVFIDVKNTVIKNIEEILNTEITNVAGDTTTIIDMIKNQEGNVIYKEVEDATDPNNVIKKWVFQYYDSTKKEYVTIDLDELVKANETITSIGSGRVDTAATAPTFTAKTALDDALDLTIGTVLYQYKNEGTDKEYINLTEDILYSIENNDKLNKFIKDIINQEISSNGGNVYYGDHDGDANTPHVFYEIILDSNGDFVENKAIDIFTIIKNVFEDHKDEIKNLLGDHITTNNTYVKTGDTIDGRDVYMAKATISIAANTAATSGFTISGANMETVLSIKVLQDLNLVTTAVTDVVVSGGETVNFNIGIGKMYQVLPAGDYEVVVEFLAPVVTP